LSVKNRNSSKNMQCENGKRLEDLGKVWGGKRGLLRDGLGKKGAGGRILASSNEKISVKRGSRRREFP